MTNGHAPPDRPSRAGVRGRSDGQREQAILAAAAQLFDTSGYDRVGVDDIGALVGISGPAIYRYFSGKDEILAALFDAAMDRLLLLCGRLPEEPFEALHCLIAAHIEFAVQDSALLSVYTREERSLAEPARRHLHRRQREHLGRWADVLARCFPDRSSDEHEMAAHAAIGMIHSIAQWQRSARRRADPAGLLRLLVTHGLAGLASDS